jgi:monofunctional glycosyltransferase
VTSARHAATWPVADLARRTPERTALMRDRLAEPGASGTDRRWLPYDRISPLLRRAVLVAEDDAFFTHGGFDWNEIQASARKNLEAGRIVRGGSTITQQLARNLYLGTERTWARKLEEAFVAVRLERTLTKRRIFELYLNLIEWGDGIYGCEAAAQRDFGVSAADLSPRQAVLLAAVIINPRRFSPLAPNRRIERRVRIIATRLRRRGVLDEVGYQLAIGAVPTAADSLAAAHPAVAESLAPGAAPVEAAPPQNAGAPPDSGTGAPLTPPGPP